MHKRPDFDLQNSTAVFHVLSVLLFSQIRCQYAVSFVTGTTYPGLSSEFWSTSKASEEASCTPVLLLQPAADKATKKETVHEYFFIIV